MAFKLANGSGKVITKLFWIVFTIGIILTLQMIYPEQVSYAIMAILGFAFIVFLFSFWFFRDPERWPDLEEENDRAIIAPADGKVIKVDKYLDEEYRMEESQRVSIFMSVFNVHVNRYPVKGKVEYVNYKKGKFMAAWNDKASEYNEQAVIGVNANGNQVTIKQIAGLIAQRIICYSDVGDEVEQSQKLGLIRFGSRVDIILPDETDIKVKVGDKVKAGETVIGEFFT
ncbi:MAG: phosphatidylserine decarboxylase family protein [Candidatus Delongbacteria bacterium]|nr:phosphatidylserine decarboxylase family protein [Candidatus Delongbacteria bacterium]